MSTSDGDGAGGTGYPTPGSAPSASLGNSSASNAGYGNPTAATAGFVNPAAVAPVFGDPSSASPGVGNLSASSAGFFHHAAPTPIPVPASSSTFCPRPSYFGAPAPPFAGSSSTNPVDAFGTFHLNAATPWPLVGGYNYYMPAVLNVDSMAPPPLVRGPAQSPWVIPGFESAPRFGPAAGGSGSAQHVPARDPSDNSSGQSSGGRYASGARRGRQARIRAQRTPSNSNAPLMTVAKPRAQWDVPRTSLLCDLYCLQLENGNCKMGVMSKAGWADIRKKFYEQTQLNWTTAQFTSKLSDLRKEWHFCNALRYGASGVGLDPDTGKPVADEEWWKQHTKGHKYWKTFKDEYPPYLDQMDRMFADITVDGSTSYVPGAGSPTRPEPTSEEADEDADTDADLPPTPLSTSTPRSFTNKRASSTDTTGCSPRKRSSSPAVRVASSKMSQGVQVLKDRNTLLQEALRKKLELEEAARNEHRRKVDELFKQAYELGVNSTATPDLYRGLIRVAQTDNLMDIFFNARTPEDKLFVLRDFSRAAITETPMNSTNQSGDDGFWEIVDLCMQDDDELLFLEGKYYLVDSGYKNQVGFLAPFKGYKYHHQEYRNAAPPQGMEETFNYAHSSLRNVVERAIGVLKMKWRMLKEIPSYDPHKQSEIIQAACALHNFVRRSGIQDRHFGWCDRDENYVPAEAYEDQPEPERVEDDPDSMNEFRESLACQLFYRS